MADIDGDGDNDFDDIDGFVDILITTDSEGTQTVPEPGTAVLLGVGGLVWCGLRRRTRRNAENREAIREKGSGLNGTSTFAARTYGDSEISVCAEQ